MRRKEHGLFEEKYEFLESLLEKIVERFGKETNNGIQAVWIWVWR